MEMKMRKRMICFGILILLCLFALSACTSANASGAYREKKVQFSDDEVKARAMDYLEKYWMTTKKYDFEGFKAEYLEPGNTFFNLEMEIRSEVSALSEKYFEVLGDRITEEELFLREDLEVVGVEDYYVVTGHGNWNLTYESDGGKVGSVDTDFIMTLKPVDNRLLLVDFVDDFSGLFNKDVGINEDSKDPTTNYTPQEWIGTHVPYGQNQMTEVIVSDTAAKYMSEQNLKKIQLENIESAREYVRNNHQMLIDRLKK